MYISEPNEVRLAHMRYALIHCHINAGINQAVAWYTSTLPPTHLIRSAVASRTCKTMLKSSSSLSENMTEALAQALGVESGGAGERFKVGGVSIVGMLCIQCHTLLDV